jgi:hypothetical protein
MGRLAALLAVSASVAALAGCGQMAAALDKQWMTVQFGPGTSLTTELHVRVACSHVENTPPLALPAQHSLITTMDGIGYDTTNASPANLAQLQTCLQRFKSVVGVSPQSAADEGS